MLIVFLYFLSFQKSLLKCLLQIQPKNNKYKVTDFVVAVALYAGKVFMYWLGTEPFVYIADPEFLKKMSKGIMGKSCGNLRITENLCLVKA